MKIKLELTFIEVKEAIETKKVNGFDVVITEKHGYLFAECDYIGAEVHADLDNLTTKETNELIKLI